MRTFSIKDLAEFSVVKQHTIRVWEQRYSFLKPNRFSSSHRSYTVEDLRVFLDVVLLNYNGYKISKIDQMSMDRKVEVVSKILDQQQKSIHELIILMARMDAEAFEVLLKQSILVWGVHATIQQVLLPFCDVVGLLQGGFGKNYRENLLVIRQSIKQLLCIGIQEAPITKLKGKQTLLFLLPGNDQELSLLNLQYHLKMEGYSALYLGRILYRESDLNLEECPIRIFMETSENDSDLSEVHLFSESVGKRNNRWVGQAFESRKRAKNRLNSTYCFADAG